MKFWIFVALCLTLGYKNKGTAQNVDCKYKDIFQGVVGHKNLSRSFYTCFLETKNSNFYYNGPLNIQGQHFGGRNDRQVEDLIIENDEILRKLSSDFCKKFNNLEELAIREARTGSIDENALQNCEKLFYLEIDRNDILELPEFLLIRNSKLEIIFIVNNTQLTTLPANFFINQKNLGTLYLYDNQLNFLPSGLFSSLKKLQILLLNNNELQAVDPVWLQNLQNLEKLGLNDNHLTELPAGVFIPLKKLEKLWIHKNRIKTLHPDCFVGLENLKVLALHTNEISDLPQGVFSALRNLELLDLSDNKLSVLHSDSFGLHSQLTKVYLENNKITAIDEKIIENTAISFINMQNNICNSEVLSSRNDIKTHLKTCFQKYRPRQQVITQQPVTKIAFNSCGLRKKSKGNIVGGQVIEQGDFPWIAALVYTKGDFFCGGTLVSSQKVVTAAHCILNKGSSTQTLARDFRVLLGVHNLDDKYDVHRAPYAVQTVMLHDDWNPFTKSADADIAVLLLDKDVTFTDYIQPICLIEPQSEAASITEGVVVGYGKTEEKDKKISNVPKVIDVPIQTSDVCFESDDIFLYISSGRTFCAGTGSGTGVCSGDSGGALVVKSGDVYYFRGIVSTSLIGGPHGCDLDNYAVYTDMLKFNDWVKKVSKPQYLQIG